jgi:alcohol dehydrogenase class IV
MFTAELAPRPLAIFGAGCVDRLDTLVLARGTRPLVITDAGVVAAGVLDQAIARLPGSAVFDGVTLNPGLECVVAGIAEAHRVHADVIIGVGGGASLDVAKAVALGAANDVDARDLDYRAEHLAPGLPVLAVPTTAGTGSETNGFGVFADADTGRKIYLGNATVQPFAALLDPELTLGLPAAATGAAGMDALAHALESLCARSGNPYSAALAHGVARSVRRFLPRAVADGTDLEARGELLFAAHLAGHAQQTTGLGLAHGIAHALSSHLGVVHGLACAVALPPVLAVNRAVREAELAGVAPALGATGADEVADAVQALSAEVGTAVPLAARGLTAQVAGAVARDALADVVTLNAPVLPSLAEVESIVQALA